MGTKKALFLIILTHSVLYPYAQSELTIRPSVGLQNVFAKTNFTNIDKLQFKNNAFDQHFYASLEINKRLKNRNFIYITVESRIAGYSYSSLYSNPNCPQQTSRHFSSTAYSFIGVGSGYGGTLAKRKEKKSITTEISASSGLNLLLNQNNIPLDDMTRGESICNDLVFYTDKFIKYNNWGVGLQAKLYVDIYINKKAILNFSISYLQGLKNVTYDQLISRVNSASVSNTFVSKGSGFSLSVGYPFTIFKNKLYKSAVINL